MTVTLFTRRRIAAAVAAGLTVATLLLAGAARSEPFEAMRERYVEQCRAQVIAQRGRNPGNRPFVIGCVKAKMASGMRDLEHANANAPTPGGEGLKLFEFTPWLDHPTRGPAEAKGVIYFVGGYTVDQMLDDFKLGPYLLKTLSEDGWDIIFAKMPQSVPHPPIAIETLGAAARTVERRAQELRAQGYKRVVVGGHSWGGWVALVAGRDHVAADALLISAPTTFGPNISPFGHGPNSNFGLNLTEFPAAIDKVDMPTVLIIPDDNIWDPDPAARGVIAAKHFSEANVPNILLAKPPGFYGHFTSWLPFFDFVFGKCIGAFFEAPKTQTCPLPPMSNNDFRSILQIRQVVDADRKRITSAEALVGKKFDVWFNGAAPGDAVASGERGQDQFNRRYDYLAAGQRTDMIADKVTRESFTFRDGLLCANGECSTLIGWSDRDILEFDAKTGKLKAWWIADK